MKMMKMTREQAYVGSHVIDHVVWSRGVDMV